MRARTAGGVCCGCGTGCARCWARAAAAASGFVSVELQADKASARTSVGAARAIRDGRMGLTGWETATV